MNTMEEYMRTRMLMGRKGKSVMPEIAKLYQEINDLRMLNSELTQRKEWVGLTDEEIAESHKNTWVTTRQWADAVLWAEAKLKEKNT